MRKKGKEVMKSFFLLLFLIISIAITSNAFTEMNIRPGNMRPGNKNANPGSNWHENIDPQSNIFFGDPGAVKLKYRLTDKQVDKIGRINCDYIKKLLIIRKSLELKKVKLHRLLIDENIKLNDVRSLLEEISTLEVEIKMMRINQALDIKNALSIR